MALSENAALAKDKRTGLADMQHRHFATVADIISTLPHGAKIQREVAEHFADRLRRTNDRFNRTRFLAACDLQPEE